MCKSSPHFPDPPIHLVLTPTCCPPALLRHGLTALNGGFLFPFHLSSLSKNYPTQAWPLAQGFSRLEFSDPVWCLCSGCPNMVYWGGPTLTAGIAQTCFYREQFREPTTGGLSGSCSQPSVSPIPISQNPGPSDPDLRPQTPDSSPSLQKFTGGLHTPANTHIPLIIP